MARTRFPSSESSPGRVYSEFNKLPIDITRGRRANGSERMKSESAGLLGQRGAGEHKRVCTTTRFSIELEEFESNCSLALSLLVGCPEFEFVQRFWKDGHSRRVSFSPFIVSSEIDETRSQFEPATRSSNSVSAEQGR